MPRLTACLLRGASMRWKMRNEWRHKREYWEPRLIVPHELVERGVELVDPVEKYMSVKEEPWVPTVPDDPKFADPPTEQDHPDYHEDPIYSYTINTRMLGSTKQALVLTKSQLMEGLPPAVTDSVGTVTIPGQDELVQSYIMQAHKWDPTKEKLKKRVTHLPIWNFKAETGIPQGRVVSTLLQNVLRLCMTTNGRFPDMLSSRRHLNEHHYSATYQHQGKPIQISNTCDWLVTSNRPLTPFADETQVIDSVGHDLPNIYPMLPTIDLQKIHVYREDNISGIQAGSSHCHPHTLFLNDEPSMYQNNADQWRPEEYSARALVLCHGQALALAHSRYGSTAEDLPEPICVQCVHSDGVSFNFVSFQLNTLDISSSDGIKNFAWIDSGNKMFEKLIPKRAMLRSTKYEDYDPTVFQKILAVYMNGVDIS